MPKNIVGGDTHSAETNVCHHCGAHFMKSTAKFCSRCGTKKKASFVVRKEPVRSGNDNKHTLLKNDAVPTGTFRHRENSKDRSSGSRNNSDAKEGGEQKKMFSSTESSRPLSTTANNQSTKSDKSLQDAVDAESSTLRATPEEEERYSSWATLSPDGITPEMLQTSNASELKSWRRGLLIGRGTYGSVYLGLLDNGAFYAVKCVEIGGKTGVFSIKELVSLSREINMMQRLHHKNLCTFKGVYYDSPNSTICMFMEYIGGGSLTSLVKKFKPLPPGVVRSWTRQLLSGLLYLHTQRIIHRDIKGDNLLVDTSSEPKMESQIKLVDFGAARRLSDAVAQSRTVIGTPYWMAPEVVDVTGTGDGYSYKADVWSVGCTVAEMLTGKPPWPSQVNAPAAIMMIAQAKDGPTEIPTAEATPGCLDFMKKCFVKDPAQRPTVEELMQHPWILGEME